MKKFLLLTTIALALSHSAFALEITKGKLLQHKEWATGKLKVVSVKHNPRQKSQMYPLNLLINETFPGHATAGLPFTYHNETYAQYHNQTAETTRVYYQSGNCIEVSKSDTECSYFSDSIELEPDGSFYDSVAPELSYAISLPGTYETFSYATISSTEGDLYLDSRSANRVRVSANNKV